MMGGLRLAPDERLEAFKIQRVFVHAFQNMIDVTLGQAMIRQRIMDLPLVQKALSFIVHLDEGGFQLLVVHFFRSPLVPRHRGSSLLTYPLHDQTLDGHGCDP